MKVTNINKDIINQLLEKLPEKKNEIEKKFPKYKKWIEGADYPTYNQLIELSKIFHIPFGYFFLEKLPKRKYPIPHYRTTNKNGYFKPSDGLFETLLFAQKIQEWAKDILSEWGKEKLDFCGKYKDNHQLELIIKELKKIFEIKQNWASQTKSWSESFNYLVEKAEEKGIIVLINGVMGNNTRYKLDVKEFRGFVLYDDLAPVIFINNNDAISAKIFTLIHEVVHILIGESASFDLKDLQSVDNEIEKFCDQCTAEFLVPENELREIYRYKKGLDELAKHFKVSQIVILRRLLDISLVDKETFHKQLKELYDKEIKKSKGVGGDFYKTAIKRLSKRFLYIINSAVSDGTISLRDALKIINLNSKTFDELIRKSV